MSIQAVHWAMHTKTGSPASKALLMTIAEHANGKTHSCWPSVATLAKFAELCVRSVRYHLKKLEKLGLIVRQAWSRKDKGQTTNRYTLAKLAAPPLQRDAARTGSVEPNKNIIGIPRAFEVALEKPAVQERKTLTSKLLQSVHFDLRSKPNRPYGTPELNRARAQRGEAW